MNFLSLLHIQKYCISQKISLEASIVAQQVKLLPAVLAYNQVPTAPLLIWLRICLDKQQKVAQVIGHLHPKRFLTWMKVSLFWPGLSSTICDHLGNELAHQQMEDVYLPLDHSDIQLKYLKMNFCDVEYERNVC